MGDGTWKVVWELLKLQETWAGPPLPCSKVSSNENSNKLLGDGVRGSADYILGPWVLLGALVFAGQPSGMQVLAAVTNAQIQVSTLSSRWGLISGAADKKPLRLDQFFYTRCIIHFRTETIHPLLYGPDDLSCLWCTAAAQVDVVT